MTMRVVALTGIPGVGKTTMLGALGERLSFVPLQASALLRKAREGSLGQTVPHDALRYADLDENQRLLIQSFGVSTTDAMRLIVLDSHTIIERDDGYVVVDPTVFAAIGIRAMVFVHDSPEAISLRRERDAGRRRPERDAAALGLLQDSARVHAEKICRLLDVPLYAATPREVDEVGDVLRRVRDAGSE